MDPNYVKHLKNTKQMQFFSFNYISEFVIEVPSEKERKNVTFSENIIQVKVSVRTIDVLPNEIKHVKKILVSKFSSG